MIYKHDTKINCIFYYLIVQPALVSIYELDNIIVS